MQAQVVFSMQLKWWCFWPVQRCQVWNSVRTPAFLLRFSVAFLTPSMQQPG